MKRIFCFFLLLLCLEGCHKHQTIIINQGGGGGGIFFGGNDSFRVEEVTVHIQNNSAEDATVEVKLIQGDEEIKTAIIGPNQAFTTWVEIVLGTGGIVIEWKARDKNGFYYPQDPAMTVRVLASVFGPLPSVFVMEILEVDPVRYGN